MQKAADHHPPHIFLDDAWHIVTASTYKRQRFLAPETHKIFMRDYLKSLAAKYRLTIAAWVILDNHYHLLFKSKTGDELPSFFRYLHGKTAYEINKLEHVVRRKVWHNYWDTCIRSDADYWTRFNYIHYNPVKHGYVREMEDWSFSSYGYYREHKGQEWLDDAFRRYPVIDFSDSKDTF